jgi:hypothetical protein
VPGEAAVGVVQAVARGARELGRRAFRRPVPQDAVDAAHARRRRVGAHACNHTKKNANWLI